MLIPVILSGGAGTRLWPVSREGHPKPFMKLADGESLLQKTYQRAALLAEIASVPEIVTVTNRDYFFMSKDEITRAKIGAMRSTYLLEPMGRNTAPAIMLATKYIEQKFGADATILVLAADHLILDTKFFAATVKKAIDAANQKQLIIFGIQPTAPETGYGYIECAEQKIGEAYHVARFVEKPNQEKAAEYLAKGNYLWNSGMFCFQAGIMLDEMRQHAHEVFEKSQLCWDEMQPNITASNYMLEIPQDTFSEVPDISIDYAVLEHSKNVAVIPSNFGWSDIGSWDAVSLLAPTDDNNNRIVGETMVIDSHNNYIQSEDRLVATLGVDDLLIIDTPDALLVSHRNKAQDIKKIVATLKKQNHDAYKLHRTVMRPWGSYTILKEGLNFKIKQIQVKPGGTLSLQMHHHRSEHWVVVAGMAKVINDGRELFISTNQSTYIPAGHQHRLENPGVLPLVMIEVQSGEYLGEDDIVRFEDIYGRT